MIKRFVTALMFLVMIASILSPGVSEATAGAVETYQNLFTGLCLSSNTAADVSTRPCNGGTFQKWTVIANSDGTRSFKSSAIDNFCLVSNNLGVVYTLRCDGRSSAKWTIIHNSDGSITFRNLATSSCLSNNLDQTVYTFDCSSGGSFQRWR
jgi:hypothetical protein